MEYYIVTILPLCLSCLMWSVLVRTIRKYSIYRRFAPLSVRPQDLPSGAWVYRPLITGKNPYYRKNPYQVYIDTFIGDQIFTVVGPYWVRRRLGSLCYDFTDCLL